MKKFSEIHGRRKAYENDSTYITIDDTHKPLLQRKDENTLTELTEQITKI